MSIDVKSMFNRKKSNNDWASLFDDPSGGLFFIFFCRTPTGIEEKSNPKLSHFINFTVINAINRVVIVHFLKM